MIENMDLKLEGKVGIVTGASRGIGREIALTLGRYGVSVAVNYCKHSKSAQEVVEKIENQQGRAIPVKADVSNKDEVIQMVEKTLHQFGQINILVNNAGICPFAEFFDITEKMWDRVLSTNLKGAFLCCRYVAEVMKEQGGGKIVNISSISGIVGSATQVHYCSSKGGENMLTKSLAIALAPYKINVNAILPGTVITDSNREYYAQNPEIKQKILERTPLKKFGSPADIANVAAFLCSEKADWVTGSLWPIHGGFAS